MRNESKHVLSRARPGTCVQRAFISKVKAIEMRGQFTRGAPHQPCTLTLKEYIK